jgi:tetratricopeptide (TPR) repeat protein
MIVRDEAAVIERCLDSVRDLLDAWVICDTGSVDETRTLVGKALDGIPGTLYERPWREFGHNRSELMRLARGAADYLLLLDADMTVASAAGLPDQLTADSYLLRHAGEPEYWVKRLVRGDRSWFYVGSTHEYLTTEGQDEEERLDALVIEHHGDGGARTNKLQRDVELLERDLAHEPTDARALFYLAQTYRDLGQLQTAAELYERRASMDGWREEVFYSLYQAGVLYAELGDWPTGMSRLIRSFEVRPARLEPLYELASRLRLRREYETAHLFAARGIGRTQPDDILFVHPWIYRWGLLFEYSITAYWTGNTRDALEACNQLLALPDLPDEYRRQTLANRRFCLERTDQNRTRAGRSSSHTLGRRRTTPDGNTSQEPEPDAAAGRSPAAHTNPVEPGVYPSRAFPAAHPNRLATVAQLHGIAPAAPANARVLELGCGAAVNLLSIATAYPGSRCVGVDVDEAEIALGRHLAEAAGLDNVELVCADLQEVGGQLEEADYILVHGVWSWVEEELRAAIAALCAEKLAPQGVALISYNALPGWHLWHPARALAQRVLGAPPASGDRVAGVRHALKLARDLHGNSQDLYGRVLAATVERYERHEAALLVRDDLGDQCTPLWLDEVRDLVAAAGLTYLGEAIPQQWWQWRLDGPSAERIRGASAADAGKRQQLADFASGTDFKATLFVRSTAQPALEPDPKMLAGFHALARDEQPPVPRSMPAAPREVGSTLSAARPSMLTVRELAGRCNQAEESVAAAVLRLVAGGRADLYLDPPPYAHQPGKDHPEVPALARAQARSGAQVTSLLHQQVVPGGTAARELLSLTDGTRDRTMLASELSRISGWSSERAARAVDQYLERLAADGLLLRHPSARGSRRTRL